MANSEKPKNHQKKTPIRAGIATFLPYFWVFLQTQDYYLWFFYKNNNFYKTLKLARMRGFLVTFFVDFSSYFYIFSMKQTYQNLLYSHGQTVTELVRSDWRDFG